jgi:hypothetical protein
MHDISTYHIELQGQVNENDINAMSPLWMTVVRREKALTLLQIRADQAGLVGLIRHLHGRGFVLFSVTRER